MASMRVYMSKLSTERGDSDIKSADKETSRNGRNSGINRNDDIGDLSDDAVDLPPLEVVLKSKIASTLSNQGCKRKSASLTNLSHSDRGVPKRQRDRASRLAATSPGKSQPLEIIDLTTNTEHCALCPSVLGKERGIKARIVAFASYSCSLWQVLTESLPNVVTPSVGAVLNRGYANNAQNAHIAG
ncbi:hypothetical protein BKA64DRAFT_701253 [Cadophora sp. MPI-SDFR-AT-0126]|nr:hypothetical protein BKA64DRAFT_701253 [Leotiomycetes sp. MPI-SDFR-AT-0126]